MVGWGIFWGVWLGVFIDGPNLGLRVLLGAAFGALAGHMLRAAVRSEVARMGAARASAQPADAVQPHTRTPDPAPVPVPAWEANISTQEEAKAPPSGAAWEDAVPILKAVPSETAVAPSASPLPLATTQAGGSARPPAADDAAAPPWQQACARWLLGGNTILRLGVLVLFAGLAFLAKYSIEHALLPPQLRLAGIGLVGVGLFGGGVWMRRQGQARRAYALTLQGAGVAVLYLCVFAAFRLYQFLPAGAAFAVLALVCVFSTAVALAQNAQAMAFIGFAGAFAAPVLVSTGQGSHVALFSYYLLLGVAIAAIAWVRAWRALNLLGFVATFAVATVWGVLQYQPAHYASTQPFLAAFFLVYVAAAVLYATRHGLGERRAVDGTLVFGVPLVAFGLQMRLVQGQELGAALSALALSAFYLLAGLQLARRKAGGAAAARWLAECFAALGLGFVTLAVPLAFDAQWTAAAWAVEGAAVYALGRRQDRWLARAAGLALQALAAAAFLHAQSLPASASGAPPWVGASLGAVMLAASALALAVWTRDPMPTSGGAWHAAFVRQEAQLATPLLWVGFLWWQYALHLAALGTVPSAAWRVHLGLLGWVASAALLQRWAALGRERPWAQAATPAWLILPVLAWGALAAVGRLAHPFVEGGWLSWPLLLALHVAVLRRLDGGPPAGWWPWVHAGGVWLVLLLAGDGLVYAVRQAELLDTAWGSVVFLAAATAVLLALTLAALSRTPARRWPLLPFARAYGWTAAVPLAAGVACAALGVALQSNGDARPLPYVPLLNPTDLTVALALGAAALWLHRLQVSSLAVPAELRAAGWRHGLAGAAFVALNTVWLRVAHHWAGVPWDAQRLFDSFLVQAGYSILWTTTALITMVWACRRRWRGLWMAGAVLLAATALKLFVLDLSNSGGSERIVAFIVVGLLMMVVGYFAPLPPQAAAPSASEEPAA